MRSSDNPAHLYMLEVWTWSFGQRDLVVSDILVVLQLIQLIMVVMILRVKKFCEIKN